MIGYRESSFDPIGGNLGLIPVARDSLPMRALGTVLINTRREAVSTTPAGRRRKLVIVAAAMVAFAIVLGITIYFKGA